MGKQFKEKQVSTVEELAQEIKNRLTSEEIDRLVGAIKTITKGA